MENNNRPVFESSRARVQRRYGVDADGGSDALEAAAEYLITHADNIGKDEKTLNKEVKEMRETLRLLQQGAIKGSDAKRKEVIDQYKIAINASEKSASAIRAGIENLGKSVAEHMPAVDQVIGALTVANPAAGLAVNVVKSFMVNSRERKRAIKEERQATLQKIKEEKEAALKKQVAAIEEEKAAEFRKKQAVERMNEGKKHKKEMLDRLDNIHAANLKMLEIWDGNDSQDNQLLQAANDESENTEKLVRLAEEEKSDREQDKMTQLETDREGKGGLASSNSDSDDEEEKKDLGLFGSLGKGLGGIFGKLGKFLVFIKKFAGFGLKLAGFVGLIWGGVEGFKNAAEILGKDEGSLTLADKLGAALGNIIGWFGTLLDSILGMFGIQTNYGEQLTSKVAHFFADVFAKAGEWITSFFTPVIEYFQNNSVAEIGGDIIGKLFELPGMLLGKMYGLISELFDMMGLEGISNAYKNLGETLDVGSEMLGNIVSDLATSALEGLADFGGWLGRKVYEWFSDESDGEQDTPPQRAWEDGSTPSGRFVTSSAEGRAIDAQIASQARTGGDTNVVAPTTNNNTSVTHNHVTGRSSNNQESVFSTLNRSNAMYAM